jgi:chemotaxis response regulator CheB
MRTAIRKALEEVRNINVVGEASTFADTVQKIADLKPDVLLLDLHLPEESDLTPALLKSQLGTVRTLAISLSNDTDSKGLAESYGALTLLDKMTVPAILHCVPKEYGIGSLLRNLFKRRAHAAV